MSAIGAVSSVMTQALMLKPPSGSLLPQPPGVKDDPDGDGSAVAPPALSTGKLVNISA